MAISFHTEQTSYVLRKKRLIKASIEASVRSEGYICGDISIVLCSDERLLEMNIQFLEHDYYTDIITFDYSDGKTLSGDLFISIDRVKDNAGKNHVSTTDELYRVVIHGIMHLAGYKDKKKSDVVLMRNAENRHLSKWKKTINKTVSRETKISPK
jgi:rRNA maturation RNase YbeY